MADVQENVPVKLDAATVRAVIKDPELRSLRPGSDEYKAAFAKKFSEGNDTKKTESAAETTTEAKTKKEVSGEEKTNTSTEDNDAGRSELSKKAQRRFDKLSAEKKALEARIAELEEAGKTPKQAEKQAVKETKQAPSSTFDTPRPDITKFETITEYQEALTDWKLDKREFEKDQTAKAKTAQDSTQKAYETFAEKGAKLEKEMGLEPGDFQIITGDEGFKLFDSSRAAILESDFGPQIAIEIASDDATKERFAKMSAVQQLTFIGKLEAKFESKKQASTESSNNVSKAKPPGKSLAKGTSGPTTGFTYQRGDFKNYEAMRKEQRPDKFKR